MNQELMYGLSERGLLVGLMLLFFAAAELGFRLGRRLSGRTREEVRAHVATIEGALLGLLALLLGFAFSMSVGRYDARRGVILAEVNDLQTTFLRAEFLPEPRRQTVQRLLREYLASRVAVISSGVDHARVVTANQKLETIQGALWQEAVLAVRDDSDEVRIGYFIDSLNHLFDDHTARVRAMEGHVPEAILLLLVFVASMTIAMTGYSSGLSRARITIPRVILIALTAATLLVVIDLDRPRRGLIRVGDASLLELQAKWGGGAS